MKGGVMDSRLNQPMQGLKVEPLQNEYANSTQKDATVQEQTKTTSPSEVMGNFDPTKNLNTNATAKIDVKGASFWYGAKQALYDVTVPLRERQVTALIGPSG